MTGEEFYLEFKNALNALGVGWGHMELVEVIIENGKIRYSYDNVTIEIRNKETK